MPRTRAQAVVDDEFADVEFDDVDNVEFVEDVTPVEEVQEVEDLGIVEEPVAPPPTPPQDLTPATATTTQNFFTPQASDDIEDMGVITIQPDAETFQVSVTEDIGPVFYGSKPIELKKGHLYRVSADVYEYLYSRKKLVGQ